MASYTVASVSQIGTRSGIVTTAGQLLPANLNRSGLVIQNLNATNPLFVKFGSGATSSDFDIVLKAGVTQDDGNGGTFSFDVISYTGIVSVAGTTVRCAATEW